MGANPSKPGDSGESTNVPINNSTACPVSRKVEVDKSVENSSSLCPVKRTPQSTPKVESSMCPVKHKNQDSNQNQPYKNSSVFNVRSCIYCYFFVTVFSQLLASISVGVQYEN